MKSHMLLQLPGTKFLYLPPYNSELDLKADSMDHLASVCYVSISRGKLIYLFVDMLCSWYACHGCQNI